MKNGENIGVIGYGTFGRFFAGHLAKDARVAATDQKSFVPDSGVTKAGLEQAAGQNIVILAVPMSELEGVLKSIRAYLKPGCLVMDVGSVKTKPVELMQQYVPDNCEIVATHPLFGPQSGVNGIDGLTIVTWPVRVSSTRYQAVKNYFTDNLKLVAKEISPKEHDQAMAYVQALTFYIGRVLGDMKLPNSGLNTATYEHLLEIRRIVASDSNELFDTVQRFNPYAANIRQSFAKKVNEIALQLGD